VGLLGKMAKWTSYFSRRFQSRPASVLETGAELPAS
jgi:hypothetical protein